MYAIYALIDPRDNTVFYVGVTSDVYKRFLDHIQCSGTNLAKNMRIMELHIANKMVIMETLEERENLIEAQEREGYWIRHFQMLCEPLANISKTSSPHKSKKSNSRYGQRVSDTAKKAFSKPLQNISTFTPKKRRDLFRGGVPLEVDNNRLTHIVQMMANGTSINGILKDEWGIINPGGAYQLALVELREYQKVIACRATEELSAQKTDDDQVDTQRLIRIVQMMADGMSTNRILKEEWGIVNPGGAYQAALVELREYQKVIARRAMAG